MEFYFIFFLSYQQQVQLLLVERVPNVIHFTCFDALYNGDDSMFLKIIFSLYRTCSNRISSMTNIQLFS